jgi:hypothetical protein
MTSQPLRDKTASTETTLTAFFRYDASHPEEEPYLYQNFHISHTHAQSTRHWKLRQRGMAIGRMYHCTPQSGQRWYLWRLLTKNPGPKSFTDLRTVDGCILPTFQAACIARGCVENDGDWTACFQEASTFAVAS